MKYEITYSCGHTEKVNIYGKRAEHARKLEWLSKGICSQCREKVKEGEKRKALELAEQQANEYELPRLKGSEAQIKWAKLLRFERINKILKTYESKEFFDNVELYETFLYFIRKENASFWIDTRLEDTDTIFQKVYCEHKTTVQEQAIEAVESKKEAIIIPKSQQYTGVVEVAVNDNRISLKYPLNDTFRLTVKNKGCYWNREEKIWERICDIFSGDVTDRAAEIINSLLNEGFAVSCYNSVVREKAISANFIPECKKWIIYNTDKFIVKWHREEDNDYYNCLRRIPGAKWSSSEKGMTLPSTSYREIDDFADIEGFKFSEQAKLEIEKLKKAEIIVTPNKPQKQKCQDKLAKILESEIDILDDLRDD